MIQRFLDDQGRIRVWPSKQADKLLVLEYIATKFDPKTSYTEQQINEILKLWHTFSDWPLLRRELVDRGLLTRDKAGRNYSVNKH